MPCGTNSARSSNKPNAITAVKRPFARLPLFRGSVVPRPNRHPVARFPSDFGSWDAVYNRFRRWVASGSLQRLFELLTDRPVFDEVRRVLIDSTIVRAHQHAAGAKKRAERRSKVWADRGGFSSKIMATAADENTAIVVEVIPAKPAMLRCWNRCWSGLSSGCRTLMNWTVTGDSTGMNNGWLVSRGTCSPTSPTGATAASRGRL